MSFDRHYRLPPFTIWWVRGLHLTFCATIAIGLLNNEGGTFGVVGSIVCGLWIVTAWIRSELSWPKVGLYETAVGLQTVRLSFSGGPHTMGHFPWAQIECFEPSGLRKRRVRAVFRNGFATDLLGTRQGWRITWDGGETTDMVDVLTHRLQEWRASQVRKSASAPLSDRASRSNLA